MAVDNQAFIKNYFSNLNVKVTIAGFQKVWPDWRELDFVPGYNKFYLICEGEGYIKIGDKELYPKAGQLVMMPSGIKQSYSAINDNPYTKYWCHFTAKVGEMNLFDVVEVPNIIDVDDFAKPVGICRELVDCYESNDLIAAIHLKSKLLELITYYLENSIIENINLVPSGNLEKLNLVANFIEENLKEHITIEELAGMVHVHPNYFIKLFRKYLGTTPIKYLIARRIECAKLLLRTTEDSLSVIADKTGVMDIYYLSKMFKEHTGFTPTEFRRRFGKTEG
jgi:AraC family transcriptional regulator, arabinose operon regulatory protein